jgi:RNA polymerase sigma-70 factor (ECF subfamily)
MAPLTGEVTRLLIDLREGKADAKSQLFVLLHDELRRIAASRLRNERPDHTLQPTALVNEVYLRLVEQSQQNWENRAHFLGICAHLMRQILIDYARRRKTAKRGGDIQFVPLDEFSVPSAMQTPEDLLALDQVLSRFELIYPREGKVVVMRFFGDMSEKEIALLVETSDRTVKRDWDFARAWLLKEMTK